MFEELNQGPHRRFNPLTEEWVPVSPHRTQRPWQGKQGDTAGSGRPAYDESGVCKVICFSPRHDLSVANMSLDDVTRVIEIWKNEYETFQANPDIAYAQISVIRIAHVSFA